MTANNHVTYNEAEKRYEMPFGHLVVYANVRKEKNTLYIDYVFAPEELRGKGAAGEFMRAATPPVGSGGIASIRI